MHTITIPENIQLTHPISGEPGEWVTFRRWFVECCLDDPRMGTTPSKLARVLALLAKVNEATPGSALKVDDDDYMALKAVAAEPHKALGGPLVMAQMLAFPNAVLRATLDD